MSVLKSPSRRTRRLAFDTLESRQLLTALESVAATIEPETNTGEAVDVAAPLDSSGEAVAPSSEDFGGGEMYSMESGSAPELLYFDWMVEDNIYTFFGYVTDDADVTQITIYFGGEISGAQTEVYSDGSFFCGIYLESPCGIVTAQAQDADGLWSNQIWVNIY